MKKIITLLFACLLMGKVFAKDYYYMSYHNFTQNISDSTGAAPILYVIADLGDSVNFHAHSVCFGQYSTPWQWYFNGDSIPNTSGEVDLNVIITQSGNYEAVLCYGGGFFSVSNLTDIPSIKNINFLDVFPTAVVSSITIQLHSIKTNDIEISFFDMNGRQLKTDFYKNVVGEFIKNENTEALAKGIYFLRIKAGDNMIEKKFVKM